MAGLTVVCSIGTTHPWNIAGVGLDARVCARLGARGIAVVAGVSAQGSGVAATAAIAPEMIDAQLRAVRDAGVGAYRIGALPSPASVARIAAGLHEERTPIVCDPVIASSKGLVLTNDSTLEALRTTLFARCALVTPNLAEASWLCGFHVHDRATMAAAAQAIVERDRPGAVLVTGGHLESEATDVLYADGRATTFEGTRLGGGMRGTGCALATAVAINLARGAGLVEAIDEARALVREAIAHALDWNGERVWPW